MPDGLYERDILVWSGTQADLLRRLAAGERVNDAVDWPNLIEEIEAVGRSELRACESLLVQAMLHLRKVRGSPDSSSASHWQLEIAGFLADARRAFAPSMRQNIDLGALWLEASRRSDVALQGRASRSLPPCPFTLDDLLDDDAVAMTLVKRIPEAERHSTGLERTLE